MCRLPLAASRVKQGTPRLSGVREASGASREVSTGAEYACCFCETSRAPDCSLLETNPHDPHNANSCFLVVNLANA